MESHSSLWLLLTAVVLVVPSRAAPVDGDGKLLTKILEKVNIVLDNIIAKQTESASAKTERAFFDGGLPELHAEVRALERDAEVSEPEPAPQEKADVGLEQVLDYLRYLRSQKNNKA